jgi:peptidoglycan/LPS O-acetylase OafA/YrhL
VKRFAALDSWRGLAACLVALHHLSRSMDSHVNALGLIPNSYLFVDFFFVLSGFVIAANYEQRLAEGFSVWRFALLRFGRLCRTQLLQHAHDRHICQSRRYRGRVADE